MSYFRLSEIHGTKILIKDFVVFAIEADNIQQNYLVVGFKPFNVLGNRELVEFIIDRKNRVAVLLIT